MKTNKSFRFVRVLMALGVLSLASAAASATTLITFSFSNSGSLDNDGCGHGCFLLTSTGTAKETSGLAGKNEWSFNGVMKLFTSWDGISGSGSEASGYGWSFTDTNGNDNLHGSFTSSIAGIAYDTFFADGVIGTGTIDYVVLGGTGLFAGLLGWGQSDVTYRGDTFTEYGSMHLSGAGGGSSTSVPEPAMGTLLIAGLGVAALMVGRRRRGANQS